LKGDSGYELQRSLGKLQYQPTEKAAHMLTVDGRQIDYRDAGEGPAILFVPGSFSTPAAWRAMQKHLPAGYRFVSTSLCGYGDTEDTRTLDDLDMHHQTRVVEALAEKIDAPVHLVGHSFGGTIALASALTGNVDVLSLATFEANPLAVNRCKPSLHCIALRKQK
jgi:pimeloyl-ACP methyl ester carboxylesterase